MKHKAIILILFISTLHSSCRKKELVIWATIEGTQCSDPWYYENGNSTESKVEIYLENLGVDVLEVEIVDHYTGMITCAACSCTSWELICVQIEQKDIETIQSLGFIVNFSMN